MSHSHEDRVADRPAYLCTAYGCPLMGVMCASTTGGDWFCSLHYGADSGSMQAITSAIRSMNWLAEALTMIRQLPIKPASDRVAIMERVKHDFEHNGRPDLFWRGHPENVRQWINRIEPEFATILAEAMPARMQQQPAKKGDTWTKISDCVPNFA